MLPQPRESDQAQYLIVRPRINDIRILTHTSVAICIHRKRIAGHTLRPTQTIKHNEVGRNSFKSLKRIRKRHVDMYTLV